MDVSVSSAPRRSQSLSGAASAVFVINHEDIRHSGATTIPDLSLIIYEADRSVYGKVAWAF